MCAHLTAVGPHVCRFPNASFHAEDIMGPSLCKSRSPSGCDVPGVLALSRSDQHINEAVLVSIMSFNVSFALLIILISYLFICKYLEEALSSRGIKALSTCTSTALLSPSSTGPSSSRTYSSAPGTPRT